jgi:UDP-N-acetylmuramate dehydrogenase
MDFLQHYSLKKLNTFGLDCKANQFICVRSVADLRYAINKNNGQHPIFILGGGSNILLTQQMIPNLVIQNGIKGIEIVEETSDYAVIAVGGGENWHQFVLWCVRKGLGGVENLSLIPGTVGASPIQNIGAYGVELKDVFLKLHALELATGNVEEFSLADCQFGYRDSIFKQALKGKFCISKVFFRLSKQPMVNTSYGAISDELAKKNIAQPTIKQVSEAVIAIRQSKLPDPAVLGNAGSFFKNPEISMTHFEQLKVQFPNIVSFSLPDGNVKIPAGWLIEQCGWKGKRIGNAGAYEKQALVLVNYGNATGQEIWALATQIAVSVKDKFNITITPEVNVL